MTRSGARSPAQRRHDHGFLIRRPDRDHRCSAYRLHLQPVGYDSDLHGRLIEAVGADLRDDHRERSAEGRRAARNRDRHHTRPTTCATTSTVTGEATSSGATTMARSPNGWPTNGGFVGNGRDRLRSLPRPGMSRPSATSTAMGATTCFWRHGNGSIIEWLGQPNGSFSPYGNAATSRLAIWQVEVLAISSGDGRDDLLLRKRRHDRRMARPS